MFRIGTLFNSSGARGAGPHEMIRNGKWLKLGFKMGVGEGERGREGGLGPDLDRRRRGVWKRREEISGD